MADQIELQAPLDTPSFLQFSPADPNLLLAGSWDATTRIYDVNARSERSKVDHRAAVLAGCWSRDGSRAYVGGLEAQVREINVGTSEDRVLGVHDKTVSAAMWASEQNSLITGSWDCSLRVWDPRAANALQGTHQLPERVYRADLVNNTLVCALGSRLFAIYDTRNLGAGPQQRESQLKYLTRSVAVMSNGAGFAVGSVEGRVAVEYVDSTPAAAEKKYAFKCHRAAVGDVDHVWSVNTLAFHPIYNTFASGGSDGTVSIWDHNSKKRLKQIPKHASGAGVATLAFSPDGARLALGLGYTWDEGEAGAAQAAPPSIQIYAVGDEVKPKGWTGA